MTDANRDRGFLQMLLEGVRKSIEHYERELAKYRGYAGELERQIRKLQETKP